MRNPKARIMTLIDHSLIIRNCSQLSENRAILYKASSKLTWVTLRVKDSFIKTICLDIRTRDMRMEFTHLELSDQLLPILTSTIHQPRT